MYQRNIANVDGYRPKAIPKGNMTENEGEKAM